jgi:hypothetical protein
MNTTWSRLLIGLAVAGALVISVTSGSRLARAGGTTTEATLSGPAIGGVVPEGRARADATVAKDGSFDTTLVVEVKNVNLPDGTLLGVSIGAGVGRPGDPCGTQDGTITLSRMAGTLTTDLGNFFPRGSSICVGFPVGPGGTTILGGKFGF